jgi:ABC-type sugar transport system substrate-binding protein
MKKVLAILSVLALLTPGCARSQRQGYTIGFMPKLMGIPYFTACHQGAEEAAKELGLNLVFDGPTKADSNDQIKLLSDWIHSGRYDALAVACNEVEAVAPSLREARELKIPIITYDADTRAEDRDFFVNMANYDDVAEAMVETLVEQLGPNPEGKIGILTSSLDAPNQSEWSRRIKALVKKKYPRLELLPEVTHGEDSNAGIRGARALIQANPDLKGIIGLTSVAVPAAAEAVRNADKKGVIKVTGVSTPRDMRSFVKDGTVEAFVLWNPIDLGYLTIHVCDLVRKGQMPENGTITAGRLGKIKVTNREVLLGKPMRFDKNNIDNFDF